MFITLSLWEDKKAKMKQSDQKTFLLPVGTDGVCSSQVEVISAMEMVDRFLSKGSAKERGKQEKSPKGQ